VLVADFGGLGRDDGKYYYKKVPTTVGAFNPPTNVLSDKDQRYLDKRRLLKLNGITIPGQIQSNEAEKSVKTAIEMAWMGSAEAR